MPKKFKKLLGATQGASKMDLEELLGKLPKGNKAQQLEAELMFKRLQEEQAARYAPTNPPTERGRAALTEVKKTLAKKKPDTKADAMLLAQQRAALPIEQGGLGLPPNNTPAQRALAMGFIKDRYHGSFKDINKFDVNRGSTESHAGKGVYSTDSPKDASMNYADIYGADVKAKIESAFEGRDKNWSKIYSRMRDEALTPRQQEIILGSTLGSDNLGVVYPLKVRADRPIHLDKINANELEIGPFQHYDEATDTWSDAPQTSKFNEVLDEFRELGGDANPIYETVQDYFNDPVPAREVFNAVKKEGDSSGLYDPYTGDIVSGGVAAGDFLRHFGVDEVSHTPNFRSPELNIGTEHTISFDPDNIRSRFAAFDPWRRSAAVAAAMGVAAPDLLAKEKEKKSKNKKAEGGLMHMAGGGKALKVLKGSGKAADATQDIQSIVSAGKPLTAAERAMVGKLAAEYTANQPVTRLSEALGNVGAEGKKLRVTQTDRTAAKYLGGAPFSMMQKVDPRYAEAKATWGVKTPGAAKNIANQSDADVVWSTLIGSPTQHRSNELIFDKLYKAFQKSAKEGNLNQELRTKFNAALEPIFGEGADILDPKLRKEIDTFEKRAVVGNLLLGEGLGGAQRGGSIIPGMKIMAETTEPMLRDVETFSIGPRLFTLDQGVVTRPDIHPAFPEILTGEDLNQLFVPVPNQIALPTFNEDFMARTGRKKPGYYDLTMTPPGQPYPTQFVDEDYLNFLQKEGYAHGGVVHMQGGGDPGEVSGNTFAPKPLKMPAPLTDLADALKRQFSKEKRSMSKPGAAMDVTLRGPVAFAAGAPMDIIGMGGEALDYLQTKIPGLRKPASVMDTGPEKMPPMGYAPKVQLSPDGTMPYGTEDFQKRLNQAGLTTDEERPLFELATAILAPGASLKALKYGKAGVKALAPTAKDILETQLEKATAPMRSYVVKPKGGNWLSDAVEGQTAPFKKKTSSGTPYEEALVKLEAEYTPEVLGGMEEASRTHIEQRVLPNVKRGAVLNNWVNKKLNPYIKNEMGSPQDSIRLGIERRAAEAENLKAANQAKLDKMAADIERAKARGKGTAVSERELEVAKEKFADEEYIASQGLHHDFIPEEGWPANISWEPETLTYKRKRAGFPEEGMASHPAAQDWEIKTDSELSAFKAGDLQNPKLADTPLLEQNQWINKLDPSATINRLEPSSVRDLNFGHMFDELENAINPASTLPANLKISAKDLEKMTVDDASALVGKINAWRNVQKTKADLEIANNPATQIFKEYPPENNPKGVSWRQIKRPEGLPDEEAEKFVRQAAQYEGDMMRHCVGGAGHCEPLLRGDVEIYTLRDAKGKPHVTIEVEPGKWDWAYIKESGGDPLEITTEAKRRVGITPENEAAVMRNLDGEARYQKQKEVNNLVDKIYRDKIGRSPPSRILEIKGESNRKPKDDYIPFVQDFVKSGNFSFVNDLGNTDLFDVSSGLHTYMPRSFDAPQGDRLIAVTAAKRAGELTRGLMTREEWEPIVQKYLPKREAKGGEVEMAKGGAVDYESVFNQMLQDHVGMAQGGAVDYESRFNDMLQQHVQGMAEGGVVGNPYNSNPDMSDGGRFIQAPAYAYGGAVN